MSTPFDDRHQPLDALDAELQALAAQARAEGIPPDLHDRVMKRVLQAPPPRRRGSASLMLRWSLPLAAAAILFLALSRQDPEETRPTPPVRPSAEGITLQLPSIRISGTLAEGKALLRENTRALAESAAPFLEGTRNLLPDAPGAILEDAHGEGDRS